jgi:hypothetical protein
MAESFPQFYKPRPYQAELHKMWQTKRYGIAVLSRQSGKDTSMSMETTRARLQFPKTTGVYVGTDSPSIRNILWDKSYWDEERQLQIKMLQDNVPSSLVDWKETVMEGRFKNKSILKVVGYFQTGKGQNGVGTSFDDYSFTELSLFTKEDPIPRLQPIIDSENGHKRLMIAATPRGKRNNSLWQLMKSVENRPDAQIIIRGIDDLNAIMVRNGLPVLLSQDQLAIIEDSYLRRFGNARMFQQEYHVSFEEMDAAAVYGEALSKLKEDHRDEAFNWDRARPIYCAFDIGSAGNHSDATAWIAFQWDSGSKKLYLIDCGEGHGKALPEYIDILQQKPWFSQLQQVILPWDGEHHVAAVSTTAADLMRQRFPNVYVLAKSQNVWTAKGLPNTDSSDIITMVQSVRLQMYNTYINGLKHNEHKTSERPNCDRVLDCMENYKYSYNESTGDYSPKPVHNKYSHMMDALRYVVQATKEINFFGTLQNTNQTSTNSSYVEDYSGVW